MAPAREAEKAGGMTEVPQAWELGPSARSCYFSLVHARMKMTVKMVGISMASAIAQGEK